MSATVSGALKAHIEAQGLGVPAYRDEPREGQSLPYIIITEAISIVPESAFNAHSDVDKHVSELAEVVLWQRWRDTTPQKTRVENPELARNLVRALHGVRRLSTPTVTYSLVVDDARRILDKAESVVRNVITVRLRRKA